VITQRILIINTLGLNYEGITSVLYNYISNMNRKYISFDFISFDSMDLELKEKFKKLGSVIIVPNRKHSTVTYIRSLYRILGKGYDVVHINGNSGTMVIESLLSKICGVKKVIVHCHSKSCNYPALNKILVPIMKSTSNLNIACSDVSGKWLYGKGNFLILKNAINLKYYQYNKDIRNAYRKKLSINQEIVIGHVGNFYEQKNHTFLLDVFAELCKLGSNFKLLLVGDGPYIDRIKEKAISLELENKVVFTGRRNDTNCLYQVMDIFCFPSKKEGFGMVTLEAQASDLPLLVSYGVSEEAKCSDYMFYKSLKDGAKDWAHKLLEIAEMKYIRLEKNIPQIRRSGYDIEVESEKLRQIYLG